MFVHIGRLGEVVRLPFAVANAQEDESSITATDESLEGEEPAERFSIGGYHLTALPGTKAEMLLELRERGFELSEAPQGGGGGLLVTRGNIVVDANGAGAAGTDDNGKPFGFGQGSLNLGYIIAQNRWFRIYPLLGVGGAGAGSTQSESDTEGEAAQAESPQSRPGYGMFFAGLGLDVALKFGRMSPFAGVRVGVGLRAGPTGVLPKPFLRFLSGTSVRVQASG
jgi:opacity protein-like surface antigen